MENKRINVCGIYFDNVDMNEALEIMEKRILNYRKDIFATSQILVANQDIINKISDDRDISIEKLNNSFLIIPDGESIIIASKFLGKPLKERIAGPDLMEKFLSFSNLKAYKHYFFGSKESVIRNMTDNFLKKFKNIIIAGSYSPPFVKEFNDEENIKIIEMINNSGADVLWVSLGCPKQEKWISVNCEKINMPVIAGIGAAFDFHSGNLKRAPLWIQKIKLEWFYRFLREPLRLWKRYFLGGISFFIKVMKQKKKLGKEKKVVI